MPINSHEPGHRILVGFAKGDSDELLYLRYFCEDPTCDWCVVEFGPDECKEVVRIVDSLLTHEFYSTNTQSGGTGAKSNSERQGPTSQFSLLEELGK